MTHLAAAANPIDCVQNGTTIAKGEFVAPGVVVVKNTTPGNFTPTPN